MSIVLSSADWKSDRSVQTPDLPSAAGLRDHHSSVTDLFEASSFYEADYGSAGLVLDVIEGRDPERLQSRGD